MGEQSEPASGDGTVSDAVVLGEVQLLLSEKRTSLSVMRTGIAVLALPLSVLSVLIATSKYYEALDVLHFLIPVLLLCLALAVTGVYLISISIAHMRRYDRLIREIRRDHGVIARVIE